MDFAAGDASGWDECLPSVAACTVETAAGTARIPDHGDLWRVEWQDGRQWSVDSDRLGGGEALVTLRGDCFSLPLELERTVTLAESESGWELGLDYRVSNTGSFASPWSWAAHPLFAVEEGDRIVLPDSIKTLRLEGSGKDRLGEGGDRVNWPIATLPDGSHSNLSIVQGPGSRIGDKLFAGPLGPAENWCVLERPQAGFRIRVGFDSAATPYLGLWLCYGGWPERPGPKQNCVALEPSTAAVDSLARSGEWSRVLGPGESFEWNMKVYIEAT
jgi:galactose mutarotase-like enzyme